MLAIVEASDRDHVETDQGDSAMTEPFVVEVWGKPAGIVVKEGNAFRFYAMARPFFELNGAQFTTRGHARLAAAQLGSFDRHDAERGGSQRGHRPVLGQRQPFGQLLSVVILETLRQHP